MIFSYKPFLVTETEGYINSSARKSKLVCFSLTCVAYKWYRGQVVRRSSAKALFAGSNPAGTSLMDKLVIIDGNAIIHRAYHAIPPLTDKNGRMINAAYGFTSMLLKVWRDLKPTHIVVTFDMAGPTFRHEKFKEYKATRVKADQELYDQIPLVHDVVRAFNIPIYEKKGYEADDVIGTIVSLVCHPEGVKRPKDLLIQRHTLSERSFTALRSVQDDNLIDYEGHQHRIGKLSDERRYRESGGFFDARY